MPEPVTIATLTIAGLGWVAASAAGGIVEGISGETFSGIIRATRDRFAGLRGASESQEVARAVRIAQIQALERVIREFQKVARPERFSALFTRPNSFFDQSLAFCARAVGRSTDPSVKLNLEVTPSLTSAIDGLLAPSTAGDAAGQHGRVVAALAEDAVLEELTEALDGVRLPDGFEEHFRNGSQSKPRFLDLFAVYITEQIRENQGFRSLLNSVKLAHIASLASDARELATRIEERFGPALDRLESKVDAVVGDVRQVSADLHSLGAKILAAVSADKGVPPEPLQAILERFGEEGVPIGQIPERLAVKADELLALREQWANFAKANPDFADVQEQALALIDEGDLVGARSLFSQARQQFRESRQRNSIQEAGLLAHEAEVDRLEIRYIQAAEKYREAAGLIDFDQESQFEYLFAEGMTLQDHGSEFGNNESLQSAIAVYGEAMVLKPRRVDPLGWAMTQNQLGLALLKLGERERDTRRLEMAAQAFRSALEERTRERDPLAWAATQDNLGIALLRLGERDSGTERLEEAVVAHCAALEERTHERVPGSWARTQTNLGNAFLILGQRERRTDRLENAIQAYQAALEEYTRQRVPLEWATIQNNLGVALKEQGQRERGTERLKEAIRVFRAALEERTRDRVPVDWAMTQNNLGSALLSLAERESGTEMLYEAVEAYRASCEERTRERMPLDWAAIQHNLGTAFLRLGERESGTERLKDAVAAYRAALDERTRARVPLNWAMTMNALGSALARLGERENGTERLKEAIETYRTALEEHTRERVPVDWAVTQSNLGNTLTNLGQLEISLGQLEIGTERLQEAVQAYQFALQELRECGGTYYLEIVQAGLARVLSIIAQREELVEGH